MIEREDSEFIKGQKVSKVKRNYLSTHQKEKEVKTDFINLSVVFVRAVSLFSNFLVSP